MGGGNGQKSYHARLKKQKQLAVLYRASPEVRKAAMSAQKKYWATEALLCDVCKTAFMEHTDAPTLRQHAENKHPDKSRFDCFPGVLLDLETREAEGAALMAAQVEAEQAEHAAAKAAAEANRAVSKEKQGTTKSKKDNLTGVAGWTSLAKSDTALEDRIAGYAKETVAVAQDEAEIEEDEDEPVPSRLRGATAEDLKAAFIRACADVDDLPEDDLEDLLEAVADEMARVLEEHQTDGWEDGCVVTAEIEESVEPLLSCVLNEDQTLTVMCAVLGPLSIDDDNVEE